MKKALKRVSDLLPDDRNANRGTERGYAALEASLRKLGAGRSILIDKNGRIIAGNKTVEKAVDLGIEKLVIVPVDGDTVVAVQRTDLDLKRDKRAKELAIADNRVGELAISWDAEVLAAFQNEGVELNDFFNSKELVKFVAEAGAATPSEERGFTYRIIIECKSEREQATLLKQFEKRGLKCQPLIS